MEGTQTATHISRLLGVFSELNEHRPTRMGVFQEGAGAVIDYWLEDGLPLSGIVAEKTGDKRTSIQILLLNKDDAEEGHFTHQIEDVLLVKFILSDDGLSDGLDITSANGNSTILRFENEM